MPRKSKLEIAQERARTDPERMSAIHKAGAERHGFLWLEANIAAVNAATAAGLPAEQWKVPLSSIVLRVLDIVAKSRNYKAMVAWRNEAIRLRDQK